MEEAAQSLLGCLLHRRLENSLLCGRIVETEAYAGAEDAASHAWRGPTPRNRPMFGPVGQAYVYFIYGMYHCLNVVAHPPGQAGAVLIRGLEPLSGPRLDGPGKLCRAWRIDRSLNDCNLLQSEELWLTAGAAAGPIHRGPRVGIRRETERPWRFRLVAAGEFSP